VLWRCFNSYYCFRLSQKDRNISRAPQMKKGSGAKRAIPLAPIAASRWVAMAKTITPVQKMEQKIAAQKEIRKNHFMPISVMAINANYRTGDVSAFLERGSSDQDSSRRTLAIAPLNIPI
jgi:hypothetical protein